MVHYYFQCRETLIQTTLDRFLIPISDSVWEAVDLPIGPLEMLREFHLRLREVFTKVPWYASLWSKELASSEGNLQGYMRSLINPERLRRFKEKIEQGQKQGLINPVLAPELVFPSLIALIYLPRLGLHSWEQLWNTNISEEVVTRHVWATIIDGLAAKDAGKLK
jgi:AcrR family transcriptional regulator